MSTLKVLKEYLVGEDGYLLNDDNNGKTVMLSGAWGSGKTHFWQNEIEGELTRQLNPNNKACVYVSLYGKDNIEAIKNEILFKAYESIKDENKIAKRAISAFGFTSRLLSLSYGGVRGNTGAVGDVVENFFESKKINEAESFLADGGLICLDDFERKSKHIDLNDLFGFIAQLAIDMNCKIVIILNSDVFEGEEANVFKTVKEKTVNKYFYFEPNVEELFNSIYNSTEKYRRLDAYKDEILSAIKETEELNARIYIQVLDNCLEWVDKEYDIKVLRTLVLNSICFIKNNFILSYPQPKTSDNDQYVRYKEVNYSPEITKYINKQFTSYSAGTIEAKTEVKVFVENLKKYITGGVTTETNIIKDNFQKDLLSQINDNASEINAILKFGYSLYAARDIEDKAYRVITNFIKTGILPKNPKEVESFHRSQIAFGSAYKQHINTTNNKT